MASCNKNLRKVKKVVEIEESVENYTLDLSPEEIQTLYLILMRIGGCPDTGLRKYASDILESLSGKIPYSLTSAKSSDFISSHGITFRDNSIDVLNQVIGKSK